MTLSTRLSTGLTTLFVAQAGCLCPIHRQDERDTRRNIEETSASLQQYFAAEGAFPVEGDLGLVGWGTTVRSQDRWGRDFVYVVGEDRRSFVLESLGRDGERGGEGEDADWLVECVELDPCEYRYPEAGG